VVDDRWWMVDGVVSILAQGDDGYSGAVLEQDPPRPGDGGAEGEATAGTAR
jgi:hypothetical protein